MNVLSDSDSSDSDNGRRFKTESTRAREDARIRKKTNDDRNKSRHGERSRYENNRHSPVHRRSKSPASRKDSHRKKHHSKSRSKSRELSSNRRRRSRERSRSRSRGKDRRSKDNKHSKHESSSSSKGKEKSSNSSSSSSVRKSDKEKSESRKPPARADEKRNKQEDAPNENKEKPTRHRRKSADLQSNECQRNETQSKSIEQPPSQPTIDPTELNNDKNEDNGSNKLSDNNEAEPNLMCGPSLPPHMLQAQSTEITRPTSKSRSPSPPPPSPSPQKKVYGPSMPGDFQLVNQSFESSESAEHSRAGAPMVDDISASEDDDDFIGPVPVDHEKSEAHLELEKRALELKLAKLNEKERRLDESLREREEWMIELPELRSVAGLGLQARQFRTKERDEIKDRSSWTETPRDREEKSRKGHSTQDNVAEQQSRKIEKIEKETRDKRDAEQEAMARKHKKKHKRDESLMDMHTKKLKKKSQEKPETAERRPFSRDTDLKANRFDDAQKKSIIKKAQLLDTRFSSGQTKYL